MDVENVTETLHVRVTEAAEKVQSHIISIYLFHLKKVKMMLGSEYCVNDFYVCGNH